MDPDIPPLKSKTLAATQPPSSKDSYTGTDQLILAIVLSIITYWLFAQSMNAYPLNVQKDTGVSDNIIGIALSLTTLLTGIFIVVAGGLADKLGRVKFIYIGLILSILGSICLIFANSATLLILGRAFQGISGAMLMPATLSLIKAYFKDKNRQRALSFWSIGAWGGVGSSLLVGGAINSYLGWRWVFIISIVAALIGMFLLRKTPESKIDQEDTPFDFKGIFMFVIAMVALNIIVTQSKAHGFTSPFILGSIVAFAVSFPLFITFEKNNPHGFIDFSIFKDRYFTSSVIANFCINGAGGVLLIASLYLQNGHGLSPLNASLLSIGYLATCLAMIRVGEKLLQIMGPRKPMLIGPSITFIGILLMSLTFLPKTSYLICVLISYIIFGIGLGMFATPSIDTALSHTPANKVGIAGGIFKMASSIGMSFSLAISYVIYNSIAGDAANSKALGTDHFATAGMVGFLFNSGMCLACVLAVLLIMPKPEK